MTVPNPSPIIELDRVGKIFGRQIAFGFGRKKKDGVRAVWEASLAVARGETLALVGESGSGKTTLARLAGLLYRPDGGSVRLMGEDTRHLRGRALRRLRRHVQMVFQDPYGSLDPRMTVGAIVAEPLAIHRLGTRAGRREKAAALLESVGIDPADGARYPHEFSGGQRQRVAIARALALDPALIIADEPVSALDMSIQGQILNLLADVKRARNLSYLLISHDLGVVEHLADRVAVLYRGRIVELAGRAELFAAPRHPYTRTLLAAVPRLDRARRARSANSPPAADDNATDGAGCAYAPRCPLADSRCRGETPELLLVAGGGFAACHHRDATGGSPA